MKNHDYFIFCPPLIKLITEGSATGATGRHYPNLAALSTLNNLHILRELSLSIKPIATLEIGLAFGGSALTFLATLREIWGNDTFSHTAIDPFQRDVWDSLALTLIASSGWQQNFKWIEAFSSQALPQLVKEQRHYDLVYIDGSHLFEDVFIDMYFVCDLLPVKGIVVFDDCTDPHVAKVVKFVKRNYSTILEEVNLDGHAQCKSIKQRIGNLLGYRQMRGFVKRVNGRRQWNTRFINF